MGGRRGRRLTSTCSSLNGGIRDTKDSANPPQEFRGTRSTFGFCFHDRFVVLGRGSTRPLKADGPSAAAKPTPQPRARIPRASIRYPLFQKLTTRELYSLIAFTFSTSCVRITILAGCIDKYARKKNHSNERHIAEIRGGIA